MMRFLLVENNIRYATAASADLEAETIRTDLAESGDEALYRMRDFAFDLVLLDLALPDINGNSLIRQIRTAKHDTPIIAPSSVPQARLEALTAGADDVVAREIDPAELGARIRAIVRRSRGFTQSQLQIGSLTLDVDKHDVVANGKRVRLTIKDFAILELLVLRRNMVLSKKLSSQIYGGMDQPEIKIIDVFIYRMRNKSSKAGLPTVISTAGGRGYSIKDIGQERSTITHVRPQPAQAERHFAMIAG